MRWAGPAAGGALCVALVAFTLNVQGGPRPEAGRASAADASPGDRPAASEASPRGPGGAAATPGSPAAPGRAAPTVPTAPPTASAPPDDRSGAPARAVSPVEGSGTDARDGSPDRGDPDPEASSRTERDGDGDEPDDRASGESSPAAGADDRDDRNDRASGESSPAASDDDRDDRDEGDDRDDGPPGESRRDDRDDDRDDDRWSRAERDDDRDDDDRRRRYWWGRSRYPGPVPTPAEWEPPEGPVRIGLQVGHWRTDEAPPELGGLRDGGTRWRGTSEWEVNLEIARRTAALLEARGYVVDLLPAVVPPGYRAHLFISIHADGSNDPDATGYRIAAPRWDATGRASGMVDLLERSYGEATGLSLLPTVTRRMRAYYAFNFHRYEHALHPMTIGVILETGFLTSARDRRVIVDAPERAARGIVDAVEAFPVTRLAESEAGSR